MFKTASELRMPYILMHIRGTPKTMLDKTDYKELIPDIMDYFKKKIDLLYFHFTTKITVKLEKNQIIHTNY